MAQETTQKEKIVVEYDENGELVESEDTLVDVEVPPQERDILWALKTPLDQMSLEEKMEAVKRIRELRKVKMVSQKKKSDLDNMLAILSPERASAILKQLEAMMDADKDKDKKEEVKK